jgi:hypothetical protein
MPHDTVWISEHGARVDAKGEKACEQCHDTKEYCTTCHEVKMPHPAAYVATHPKAAERVGTQTCFNCHVVVNCQACHEEHNSGDPRAHQLFGGVDYELPASSTPSATPAATGTTE